MPLDWTRYARIGRDLVSIGAIAFSYFAAAHLAIHLLSLSIEASPFWPSAGIALAALLLLRRRVWPGVALGAFFFALSLGASWVVACGPALGSSLEAIFGERMLRRSGFRLTFDRLKDIFALIVLGAMASSLVGATVSTLFGCVNGSVGLSQLGSNLWTLWVGDSMGILIVTPALLLSNAIVQQVGKKSAKAKFGDCLETTPSQRLIPDRWLELAAGLTLLALSSWMVFGSKTQVNLAQYPLEYLPFPFIVWAALRYEQLGAVLASAMVSGIAIWGVAQRSGPFVVTQSMTEAVLFLQTFMSIITITALVLASAVTERKQVETLLRKNQASLANAQRIAKIGNWDFDLKAQQWGWSDEMYRLLGFVPGAIAPTEEAYLQAVHPEDRAMVRQVFHEAIASQVPYSLDYRIQLPTGSERVVSEQVEFGATGITGTVQDITERKRYEAQLQASMQRDRLVGEIALRIRQSLDLNQILDTTVAEVRKLLQVDRVLISYMGANGKIVAESVAPNNRSCLGLAFQEPDYYQEIKTLFQQSSVQVIEDTSKIAAKTQARIDYLKAFEVKAVLGVPIWLNGTEESSPQLYGLLVAHQCTKQRQWEAFEIDLLQQLATHVAIAIQQAQLYASLHENQVNLERQVAEHTTELRQNMRELARSNQIKNIFLDAVSHDLRTTIMGNVMLLKSQLKKPGEEIPISRSLLERMIQASDRQLCKLNSLLEATELEVQGVVLSRQLLRLPPLIESILEDLEPLLEQNQAKLTLQFPENLPQVNGDREQLRRVFEHLITNAVKHNPPGVELTLGAEIIEVEQLSLLTANSCCNCHFPASEERLSTPAQLIRCYLRDNGVGIDAEIRDRLFDLYVRDANCSKKLTGISLGLYLCRQIITAHYGTIGVESSPDSGSDFWFTLPILDVNS